VKPYMGRIQVRRLSHLLSILSAVLLATAKALGQPAAGPMFDVASIRQATVPQGAGLAALREAINATPGSLTMRNVTLKSCIRYAYDLKPYEVSGPDWLGDRRFDIAAKAGNAAPEERLRAMLQALLAERFKLAVHRQSKELPAYALIMGKNGAKLQPAEGSGEGSMTGAAMVFQGNKMPLARLANILSSVLKIAVVDMTGLEGHYDFKLDLRPYVTPRQPGDPPLDLSGMAMSAVQDQLGLKLESRKMQLEVLIVDHAEKSQTEN